MEPSNGPYIIGFPSTLTSNIITVEFKKGAFPLIPDVLATIISTSLRTTLISEIFLLIMLSILRILYPLPFRFNWAIKLPTFTSKPLYCLPAPVLVLSSPIVCESMDSIVALYVSYIFSKPEPSETP